jgi:P pilus assembly chaperone PapD
MSCKHYFKRPLLVILNLFLLLVFCVESLADISISSRRIYVDNENSTAYFTVTNKVNTNQTCNLELVHNTFDNVGNMLHDNGGVLPPFAADDIIRFSPKNFELPANRTQTIRFVLRRRPGTPKMEHRAFVVVGCLQKQTSSVVDPQNSNVVIDIAPVLKHSIPLVVRPSKLEAKLNFSNVISAGNKLSFDLTRSGNRSVYGKVYIYDKNSNDLVTASAVFPIYLETSIKSLHIMLPKELSTEQIVLQFKESKRDGGDLDIRWPKNSSL